jgi:hypothetical protein
LDMSISYQLNLLNLLLYCNYYQLPHL